MLQVVFFETGRELQIEDNLCRTKEFFVVEIVSHYSQFFLVSCLNFVIIVLHIESKPQPQTTQTMSDYQFIMTFSQSHAVASLNTGP